MSTSRVSFVNRSRNSGEPRVLANILPKRDQVSLKQTTKIVEEVSFRFYLQIELDRETRVRSIHWLILVYVFQAHELLKAVASRPGGPPYSSWETWRAGRFGRQLKLGEVPIPAGLKVRVGLVQVVVQRGLGVEDLLARLAVEARLLLNVQLHQVATHVALPGATTRQSKSGQIPNKQTKGSETRQNDMNLAE